MGKKKEKRTAPGVFSLDNMDLSAIGIQPVVYPTGILPLDIATGIGGFRSGMFVELWGPESSGKTLTALLAAIEAQRQFGKKSLLIDGEFAWDPQDKKKMSYQLEWFKTLGGDPKNFNIHWPTEGSEVTYDKCVREWLPSNEYAYIIIDSWKSMMPIVKIEKDVGDKKGGAYGAAALVNSEFITQALPQLFKSQTVIICINHEMTDFNVRFGDPRTTGGGRGLKYYAKQRINMLTLKNKSVDGATAEGSFNKNKVASPGRTFRYPISFKNGLDTEAMLFDMAYECGAIGGGAGGGYTFKEHKLSGGRDFIINNVIREDPVLIASLEAEIRRIYQPRVKDDLDEHAGQ